MPKLYNCQACRRPVDLPGLWALSNGQTVCYDCFKSSEYTGAPFTKEIKINDVNEFVKKWNDAGPGKVEAFDPVTKPKHYHSYNIDTITFLKEGFPPEVYRGFLIGNIIKYTQRYQIKNGQEDLEKADFYMKELVEWEKKHPFK